MAQNEPQRKETPPGPSPDSPSLLFEYQCKSGKFIRLANRIETFSARIGILYRVDTAGYTDRPVPSTSRTAESAR